MNVSEAAEHLGLAPTRSWNAGTPRAGVRGSLLSGVHAESYWTAPLLDGGKLLSSRVSLEESLADVVAQLAPYRQFLISIRNSGGRCQCFVRLNLPHPPLMPVDPVSSANFSIEIPAALMRGLAELGLDLGFDAYP